MKGTVTEGICSVPIRCLCADGVAHGASEHIGKCLSRLLLLHKNGEEVAKCIERKADAITAPIQMLIAKWVAISIQCFLSWV